MKIEKIQKERLKPWFQRNLWAVRPLGVLTLVVSPILIPCIVLWDSRDEIVYLFEEILSIIAGVKNERD